MKTLSVVIGFILLLLIIHLSQIPEHKGKVCHDLEYVDVTHRDGFWYCHDDNTVAWVLNFNKQEWKPATFIEKRRVYRMRYTIEKDDDTYIASTEDYSGTFFGYGETKEDAIEDLKTEVEFALNGGYHE